MSSNLAPIEQAALAILATYLLHSTLLLGGAWALLRLARVQSDWLIERTWKFAAVAGLLTAPLSVLCGVSHPAWRFALEGRPGHAAGSPSKAEPSREPVAKRSSLDAASIVAPSPPYYLAEANASSDSQTNGATADLLRADAPLVSQEANLGGGESSHAIATAVSSAEDSFKAPTESAVSPAAAERIGTRVLALRGISLLTTSVILIGLLRLVVQSWRLHSSLRHCRPIQEGPAAAALARVLRRVGVRRNVRIFDSDNFPEPIACGVLRWTIVLPCGVEAERSPKELEAMLAHEAAHLARGDTLWLLIGRLLCFCLPFQPLNFVAQRTWRRSEEFLCDAWAVRHGARALSLAECLTNIAAQQMEAKTVSAGLAVGGSRAILSRRIERLVAGELKDNVLQRPLRRRMTALAGAAVIVAMSVWGPQGLASHEEANDIQAPGELDQPATPVTESLEQGSSTPTTPPAPTAAHGLEKELTRLDADLRRAESLLRRLPHEGEIRVAVDRLRVRITELRRQLNADHSLRE